ncbi:hypothetical protein BC937DRAFT_90087 [Endogone sp. FLAS-F59071]|nr:hypothetical protein BC937DRAFT_90087 [Endogone sp. FLAS-F59071]|eukprot:RUS17352.1 hypothetical protein BC937DRAFT_90087 [Endogone sp. FLAS-F59071]
MKKLTIIPPYLSSYHITIRAVFVLLLAGVLGYFSYVDINKAIHPPLVFQTTFLPSNQPTIAPTIRFCPLNLNRTTTILSLDYAQFHYGSYNNNTNINSTMTLVEVNADDDHPNATCFLFNGASFDMQQGPYQTLDFRFFSQINTSELQNTFLVVDVGAANYTWNQWQVLSGQPYGHSFNLVFQSTYYAVYTEARYKRASSDNVEHDWQIDPFTSVAEASDALLPNFYAITPPESQSSVCVKFQALSLQIPFYEEVSSYSWTDAVSGIGAIIPQLMSAFVFLFGASKLDPFGKFQAVFPSFMRSYFRTAYASNIPFKEGYTTHTSVSANKTEEYEELLASIQSTCPSSSAALSSDQTVESQRTTVEQLVQSQQRLGELVEAFAARIEGLERRNRNLEKFLSTFVVEANIIEGA